MIGKSRAGKIPKHSRKRYKESVDGDIVTVLPINKCRRMTKPKPDAVVRATNIFRKGGLDADMFSPTGIDFAKYLPDNELWALWLAASRTSLVVEQCIATSEPAYAAKHAFQLAQVFNSFYHHHPILAEEDANRKQFLLATAAVVRRELIRVLGYLGMPVPPVM